MQQSIYMFLINQTTTHEEQKKMIETFKKLDKNNDGVLSKDELREGLKNTNL